MNSTEQQPNEHYPYDAIDLLVRIFTDLQKKNSSYSLRAFAAKLELSSGAISQLMNRKRNLTRKTAKHIAAKVFNDADSARIFVELATKKKKKETALKIPSKLLLQDEYDVLKEWHYFAILSLVKTPSFRPNLDFVAKRLGLTRVKAELAVRVLTRCGYLSVENGTWRLLVNSTKTKNDVPSQVIREYHLDRLQTAITCLQNQAIDEREFGSIIFNCEQKDIPVIKSRIRKFRQDLSDEFETKQADEVCNLNVQFMKLTIKGIKDD